MTDKEPRCWKCKKKLAESLTRPWEIVCTRCHSRNASANWVAEMTALERLP